MLYNNDKASLAPGRRRPVGSLLALAAASAIGGLAGGPGAQAAQGPQVAQAAPAIPASNFIKHVIFILMENRSFDSYFGTYPGADGIPMANGVPTVCAPDPLNGTCVMPYHDPRLATGGGPHGAPNATADVNSGRMDGFLAQADVANAKCANPNQPGCTTGRPIDVMGYHDAREIPNYWAYAQNFVLSDRMFEPNASWSLPAHLFTVSEWSASCTNLTDPMSCSDALQQPHNPARAGVSVYPWTDLTYLLHKKQVSWAYYVVTGSEPDCTNETILSCIETAQSSKIPGIWNPLPNFKTVKDDGELGNITTVSKFYAAAKNGTLPTVSWIAPSQAVSDHPPASIADGQAFVTSLINAVMNSPNWSSSAIFVSWDDWGGYYDHVVPPSVDQNGYGLRVPALMISPYAKKGLIDHQTLSFDAYAKLIEDLYLGGQRLDPANDGRPDSRTHVRENAGILGDLVKEFDFTQAPLPPMILPVYPIAQ